MALQTITYAASAISIDGCGILISGNSGSGKSELCLSLMDRGAFLIGDDQIVLKRHDKSLHAYPVDTTKGKIEIRNLGICDASVVENILVCLELELSPDAPRYIESADYKDILGIHLPTVRLTPHSSILPLKAEWALRTYGLKL